MHRRTAHVRGAAADARAAHVRCSNARSPPEHVTLNPQCVCAMPAGSRRGRALVLAVVALALVGCSWRGPATGDHWSSVTRAGTNAAASTAAQPAESDGSALPGGVPAKAQAAVVASITDGDTLRVQVDGDNEAVRLLEVDAPETNGGCGASEATEYVRRFVPPGSTVWLERDVGNRDRYGRLLRYVWRDDASLLNERLVEAGWAQAKLYMPDDGRWPTMQKAQRKARDARAGIWKLCDMTDVTGRQPGSGGQSAPAGTCDPNYSGCVPVYPPDVDCDRVDGPVTVLDNDPHNLDGNHDGQACEGPPG